MNYYTKERLIDELKQSTEFLDLNFRSNSSIIISEYGGRPLGIFPKRDSFNLLWVNQELSAQISNRSRDIGGDRYWISPERSFFYKDPQNWEGWFCPEGLDPGHYEITEKSDEKCVLESPISIQNQWNDNIYHGNITRTIHLLEEPITTGINYCGIEYIDSCTLDHPDLNVNGWSLATVVSGGEKNPGTVLIPTKNKGKPISYFRPIPPDRICIEDDYIGYKIDVAEVYKLAIRPEDIDFSIKAKIGYVLDLPESEDYGLLMKLSDDIPMSQSDCFDTARDHPNAEIGVIQSYNSKSQDKMKLRYGEIELQLNRFETTNGKSKGKSTHQLIGYVGDKDEILGVIEKYMNIQEPTLF
jgi:hypothetical protein